MNRSALFDAYYGSGSSDPSSPAMFNKIFASIDDLESLLFSPVSLRFHIGDHDMPNVVNEAKGRAAASKIRQLCRQSDADSRISEAVNKGLIHGIGIIKQIFNKGEFTDSLVMPDDFGVYRENYNKLDPNMEAFSQTMMITDHQFYRLIAGNPDEVELRKKAKRYMREATGGIQDSKGSAMNIVVGGLYPLQSAGQVSATRGVVDWMSTPKPQTDPEVETSMLELNETWIWDDEREDWATFQIVGGSDMLIMGRYQILNAIAYDPKTRMSAPTLKGVHPFSTFCPNPTPGYFWGISEISRLMLLQEAINSRITGTNKMLRKQEDPSTKFVGGTGVNQLALSRFNKPGGYFVESSPQAKIERDVITIPQDLWASLHEYERIFDDMMGIPPVGKGHGEKGVRSANHAEALVRMFSPRFKDRALLIERDVENFGALKLDMARANIDKKLVAWVPADAAGIEGDGEKTSAQMLIPPAEGLVPVYFQFADLSDDVTLTVDAHSSSPVFSQDAKGLVFDMLKTGMMSPVEAVEHLDVGDVDELQMSIIRREIAKAKAQQEQDQMKMLSHAKK
ncbi:MAG: hypothetical protein KGL39_04970 [Patescibacteria group bacterium]|nr:hypothetical protein [Patescibacteria group bacterium]